MKKWIQYLSLCVLSLAILLALALPGGRVKALPEYSSQTGEPCATCHLSPSGGGREPLEARPGLEAASLARSLTWWQHSNNWASTWKLIRRITPGSRRLFIRRHLFRQAQSRRNVSLNGYPVMAAIKFPDMRESGMENPKPEAPSSPSKSTRRDFLKVAGAATAIGAGALALKSVQLPETVRTAEATGDQNEIIVKTTCGMCSCGCGLDVRVVDGRAVKIEGNPLHPLNQGVCCLRAQASLEALYSPERLNIP